MGSDLTVVNAARVSFDKQVDKIEDKDVRLLKYLSTHGHWTPFSHVMVQMRETVPIFVARQRFKHMVGFTYNEVSRRYVDEEPNFFEPEVWRGAPINAKQGSSNTAITEIRLWDGVVGWSPSTYPVDEVVHDWHRSAWWLYKSMVDSGVAPEQARMVLPQSMYTSYYVTGSLAAWARAYKLRIDPHAQKEIQDLASQWGTIIGGIEGMKHSWKALTNDET